MFVSDETLQAQSGPDLHLQSGGAQDPGGVPVLPPLQGPHTALHLPHGEPNLPHEAARCVELTEVETAVTETERGDVEVVVRGAGPGPDITLIVTQDCTALHCPVHRSGQRFALRDSR